MQNRVEELHLYYLYFLSFNIALQFKWYCIEYIERSHSARGKGGYNAATERSGLASEKLDMMRPLSGQALKVKREKQGKGKKCSYSLVLKFPWFLRSCKDHENY